MVDTKIMRSPQKRHQLKSGNNYEINDGWGETDVSSSQLGGNVNVEHNTKVAIITELPINGFLSIDDKPLHLNQIVPLSDIARLKFNIENDIERNDYGNFIFIANQGTEKEEEYRFLVDTDLINTKKTNNTVGLKNKKLEKELLEFIAKRESGVVFNTKEDSWVDATKSVFEEDEFLEDKQIKKDAR